MRSTTPTSSAATSTPPTPPSTSSTKCSPRCTDPSAPAGSAAGSPASGPLHQNRAGVEQVEPPALHVLLGLGPRLRGDDGDVASGGSRVGEPGRQQRGL